MGVEKVNIKSVEFYKERSTDFGTLYVFNVQDVDGKKYSYQSKSKDSPKVQVGEGTYEVTEYDGKNGKWYTIKPHKEFNQGGRKSTPEEKKSIATQVSQEAAIDLMVITETEYNEKYIDAARVMFFGWMLDKDGYRASNALRRAMQCLGIKNSFEAKIDPILKAADKFYKESDPNNFK